MSYSENHSCALSLRYSVEPTYETWPINKEWLTAHNEARLVG
jgi:hypothetical protein